MSCILCNDPNEYYTIQSTTGEFLELCYHCRQFVTMNYQYRQCESCNRRYTRRFKDITIGHRYHSLCPQCVSQLRTSTCEHCHTTVYIGYTARNSNDGTCYCEQCYSYLYSYCNMCRDEVMRVNLNTSGICATCTSRGDIFQCEDCGHYQYTSHESHLFRHICHSCEHYHSVIHRYHWSKDNLPLKFQKMLNDTPSNKRYYGIELEVDGGSDKEDTARSIIEFCQGETELVHIEEDGSLHDNGFEIISMPATLEFHKNIMGWNDIARICLQNDYKSHDTTTCGLHVHVSKNSVSTSTWAKVTLFWYTQAHFVKAMCRRSKTRYCCDKHIRNESDESSILHNQNGRYDAINYDDNEHTVEFRQFKGTLNANTIIATLELLDSLLNFAQKHTLSDFSKKTDILKKYIAYVKRSKYAMLKKYIATRLNQNIFEE